MSDLNQVTISGNLTKDPDLRHTPSGAAVCSLRVACNGSRKNGGEWESVPNFFDVTVWNGRAEFVADKLAKGDPVFLTGRLQWREWEAQDGTKRQAVSIVANEIKSPAFFGGSRSEKSPEPEQPAPAPSAFDDDDIPF